MKKVAGTFFNNGSFEASPEFYREDGTVVPPATEYFVIPADDMPDYNDQASAAGYWRDRAYRAEETTHKIAWELAEAMLALDLIAIPVRADGTFNRSREAVQQLAEKTIKSLRGAK